MPPPGVDSPTPTAAAGSGTVGGLTQAPRSARENVGAAYTRRSTSWGLLAVVLAPFLANLPAILQLTKYQPQSKTSGIANVTKFGYLPGQSYIDPNVGYNSQAVGHAAALAWLHGHVPWWNLRAGLGMPLAASIQNASFFPLVLLQALSNGSLWFHVGLECIAGVATFLLLRELRCTPLAAIAGGIAFGLCGSLAWLTNAPANPLPFLPMCLLAIEYAVNATGARRRGGWIVLALGVWLSIVSGFPEVTVLDGGVVACWFLLRLAQHPREWRGLLTRGALGVGVGVLLALPVLNAFERLIHHGQIGSHTHPLASLSLPTASLTQLVAPYLFGGIFDNQDPTIVTSWSMIGGYSGVMLFVLAVGGCIGALWHNRERLLRCVLGGWAILFLGASYGVPILHQIVENIPGLTHIATFRYSTGSALLCMCVLAALCLDDILSARSVRAFAQLVPGMVAALAAFAIGFFGTPSGRAWAHAHLPSWYWGSIAIFGLGIMAVLVCVACAYIGRRPLAYVILCVLLVGESLGFFLVPILAWPRAVNYDTAPVAYLKAHLGTQRYYSISPIAPNYGTYYGVASLDASDLPVPKNWSNFVATRLNPCILPWQLGNGGPIPNCVPPLFEFIKHNATYEQAGVKYLLLGKRTQLRGFLQPQRLSSAGVATPDGAAIMQLTWQAPSYYPGGVLTSIDIDVAGAVPSPLTTTVCTNRVCTSASPRSSGAKGVPFQLAAPLTLGPTLSVTLTASNASPIHVITVPQDFESPANVIADGTRLERQAVVNFVYEPASLPLLVDRTSRSNIYLLPHVTPIATAPGCDVAAHSMTSFTVACPKATVLTYHELAYPGWKASVSGRSAPITTYESVYQRITVPKGTSRVDFSYEPPDATIAWLGALLGVLAIVAGLLRRRLFGASTHGRAAVAASQPRAEPRLGA
ncbi:MAG TPA: hypothetical protein VMQ40_05065 [Acidimicrobiales bacterium]|jgi:hypothetical protein|nr:hypothetical protein [Acidimicrobiales bacterium]